MATAKKGRRLTRSLLADLTIANKQAQAAAILLPWQCCESWCASCEWVERAAALSRSRSRTSASKTAGRVTRPASTTSRAAAACEPEAADPSGKPAAPRGKLRRSRDAACGRLGLITACDARASRHSIVTDRCYG